MKLYRIQRQWWVDALLSKRMGSYHLDTPILAFERNWYSPRLQLTLSYSWGKKTVKAQDVWI